MKSTPFLKSSAKAGLSLFLAIFLSACSPKAEPSTYSCSTLSSGIVNICKGDHKLDVVAKIAGNTLWVYLPLRENLFTKADGYFTKRVEIKSLEGKFLDNLFNFSFDIEEQPKTRKRQETDFAKEPLKKTNNVMLAIARAIFSSDCKLNFIVLEVADTTIGIELSYTTYVKDFKKLFYRIISTSEFSMRRVFASDENLSIIGDYEGRHIDYKDIRLPDFLAKQIEQRIRVDLQQETLDLKKTSVEDEIIKIIAGCINTYGFKDFWRVELTDLAAKKRTIISRKKLEDFIK